MAPFRNFFRPEGQDSGRCWGLRGYRGRRRSRVGGLASRCTSCSGSKSALPLGTAMASLDCSRILLQPVQRLSAAVRKCLREVPLNTKPRCNQTAQTSEGARAHTVHEERLRQGAGVERRPPGLFFHLSPLSQSLEHRKQPGGQSPDRNAR